MLSKWYSIKLGNDVIKNKFEIINSNRSHSSAKISLEHDATPTVKIAKLIEPEYHQFLLVEKIQNKLIAKEDSEYN